MDEKDTLKKIDKWFEYYKKIYQIFRNIILFNQYNKNINIQLSFFNTIPQDGDEEYDKGQILKLELCNNHTVIEGITLKTTNSEEQLFQYVWILTVKHFIDENYSKTTKITTYNTNNSSRSFKYLLNEQQNIRANFGLTYNKDEYDEMLHRLVLYHNNYYDINTLVQNVRNYLERNYSSKNNTSKEFNNSLSKSIKTYEHLIHTKYISF